MGWGPGAPVSWTAASHPSDPSLFLNNAPLCIFSLLHVPSTFLNKVSDLLPVNIKISGGRWIKSIDFHPLAHIWSSRCGQRLKDLYLALTLADLSIETENLLHTELEGRTPKNTARSVKDIRQ